MEGLLWSAHEKARRLGRKLERERKRDVIHREKDEMETQGRKRETLTVY